MGETPRNELRIALLGPDRVRAGFRTLLEEEGMEVVPDTNFVTAVTGTRAAKC
jgi:hypothetical protein